jgi:hypothetical protein
MAASSRASLHTSVCRGHALVKMQSQLAVPFLLDVLARRAHVLAYQRRPRFCVG